MVNLRALEDRNFAVGVGDGVGIGAILYSSNVLIPVLAQEWLGYTALLAGLLLSPGAARDDPADPAWWGGWCCRNSRRAT